MLSSVRTIAVSCHCLTAGITAALAEFLPADRLVAVHQSAQNGGTSEQLAQQIWAADIWVHTHSEEDFIVQHGLATHPGLLAVPLIYFDAFHPDLCYVVDANTGASLLPHYQSAIISWAYFRGMAASQVPTLFCTARFSAMGYLNQWGQSVAELRQCFVKVGWASEFEPFFRRVQRNGVFMHSINHPQVNVLVELARLCALRLGAGPYVANQAVLVPDVLTGVIWPVYPAIAYALGVAGGSYQWRFYEQRTVGLREYVDRAYAANDALGVKSENARFGNVSMASLDFLLGS